VGLKLPTKKNLKLTLAVKEPRAQDDKDYGVQLMRFYKGNVYVDPLDFTDGNPITIPGGEGELYLALYGLGGKDFPYTLHVEESG
jgi:hypothetical protein